MMVKHSSKMKMAHKLMLLIGSVVVIAGVIVVAQQLQSSAQEVQLASGGGSCVALPGGLQSCDKFTTQAECDQFPSDCKWIGGGNVQCTNEQVCDSQSNGVCACELGSTTPCAVDPDCQGGGGGGGGQCSEPYETWDSTNNVCVDCNHTAPYVCLQRICEGGTQPVCAADGSSVCSTCSAGGGGGGGGATYCCKEGFCPADPTTTDGCYNLNELPAGSTCQTQEATCKISGGGGVEKTCFAVYGRYNPYRAVIPGSLAMQDVSELERIRAMIDLDTSAKVNETLRSQTLVNNIEAVYTQERIRELAVVKEEITRSIAALPIGATFEQMRPIFDGRYVATVLIPIATAQDLESKYVGFDLRDPRACDQTNGGGGGGQVQCDTDGTLLCRYNVEDGFCNCCYGVPVEADFVDCQAGGGGGGGGGADCETNPRLCLAECVGNPNLCGAVVLDSEIMRRVSMDQMKEDLAKYFAPIEAQMVEAAVAPTEDVVAKAVDNNILETAAVVEAVNQAAEVAATLILDIPPISAAIDATVQQAITIDAANNASEKAVGQIKALNPEVTAAEIAAVQAQVVQTVTQVITTKVNEAKK